MGPDRFQWRQSQFPERVWNTNRRRGAELHRERMAGGSDQRGPVHRLRFGRLLAHGPTQQLFRAQRNHLLLRYILHGYGYRERPLPNVAAAVCE